MNECSKMLNQVVRLELDGEVIHLVGTAHVSSESVELVRKTIDEVEPDVVAVELCQQRHDAILDQRSWDETELEKIIREGKTYLFLMQLMLSNFQRSIGDELGVKPGSEMLESIKIAKEKGLRVALVDRDIKVSLKRTLDFLSLKEKFKLLYGMVWEMFGERESADELMKQLDDGDIVTAMVEELGREVPSIKKTLLDERDRYIANKLLDTEGKSIVAVLGAGHINGIKKIIESEHGKTKKDRESELRDLEKIPKSNSVWKYLGYLVPVLIVVLVASGFFLKGDVFVFESVLKWVVINGSLSALGALIAFAHPLSILTAFVAAPLTSLNPLLAAGWFAGLMEAKMRKPKVKDFEGLLKLNSLRDYWGNGVTRILLVIAFANLGSGLGTYIAGFSIFTSIQDELISLLPF